MRLIRHPLTRLLALVVLLDVLALVGLSGRAGAIEQTEPAAEVSPTLAALLQLPAHVTDLDEPEADRLARLSLIADAIDAATDDQLVRAALVVLAWHETRLARYVHEERCSDGPRGARECDSGRARGLWQIHDAPEWSVPDSIEAQAALAARLWRGYRHRCRIDSRDDIAGAFVGYGTGGKCAPTKWAAKRAAHTRAVSGRLRKGVTP